MDNKPNSQSQVENLVDLKLVCKASSKITIDKERINYFFKEDVDPNIPDDSGWRFFTGNETDDYIKDPENFKLYYLNDLCNLDKDIIRLLEKSSVGMAYKRDIHGNFERCFD